MVVTYLDILDMSNYQTRFGPKRVAADMRETENFIYLGFMRIFGKIFEEF